jgi:hypothetical protein
MILPQSAGRIMPIRIGGVMSEVTASAILPAADARPEEDPGRAWINATVIALPMWGGFMALLAAFF